MGPHSQQLCIRILLQSLKLEIDLSNVKNSTYVRLGGKVRPSPRKNNTGLVQSTRSPKVPYSGLTGGLYTLNGGKEKYRLPESSLLSSSDGMTGALSVWPAPSKPVGTPKVNSSNHDSSPSNGHKRSVSLSDNTAKPKFLSELEAFLAKELKDIDDQKEGPSAARLAVYREAFNFFMEDFKTYKPFLSAMLNEYELMIETYSERLHFIPPMKARLTTLQAESESMIQEIHARHEKEQEALVAAYQKLERQYRESVEKRKEIETTCGQLEKEVISANNKFQDMASINRNLVSTIKRNEEDIITLHKENMVRVENSRAEQLALGMKVEASDHMVKVLRKNLDEANDLLAKAEDMKREYEQDKKSRVENAVQSALIEKLRNENSTLIAMTAEMSASREAAVSQVESSRQRLRAWLEDVGQPIGANLTLSEILDLVTGIKDSGSNKGRILQNIPVAVPKVLLDTLIGKMKKKDQGEVAIGLALANKKPPNTYIPKESDNFFTGRGLGDDVPKYLKLTGSVPNWRLSKRTTERLLKECLISKEADKDTQTLEKYFYDFLAQKHQNDQGAISAWGYNMVDALQRYSYDGDCDLFLQILNGNLPIEVLADQMESLQSFQVALIKADKHINGKDTNQLSLSEFMKTLKSTFPVKPAANIAELENILLADDPTGALPVDYVALFTEDREGNQSEFCEALREQHITEIQEYISKLKREITKGANRKGKISLSDVRKIYLSVDPLKKPSELEIALCKAFSIDNMDSIDTAPPMNVEVVLKSLTSGLIKQSVP